MAAEQDLQIVRRIVLEKLSGVPARVYLFGSHATGRAAVGSDIDVAILPEERLPAGLMSEVREALQESNVLSPVDVVDLSKSEDAFRDRVLREGIVWNA